MRVQLIVSCLVFALFAYISVPSVAIPGTKAAYGDTEGVAPTSVTQKIAAAAVDGPLPRDELKATYLSQGHETREKYSDKLAAYNLYKKAYDIDKADPEVNFYMGSILGEMNRDCEAIPYFDYVHRYHERNSLTYTPLTHFSLAVTMAKCGRDREAIKLYFEILDRGERVLGKTHAPECHYMLGKSALNIGKFQLAIKHFEKARKVSE
jgi:tetratricopeptide (TPR) repeat protein